MTRKEIVLNKLSELSDAEINKAIAELTHFVKARLRLGSYMDKTKSGAHHEANLGMKALDYYVSNAVKALYEPDGWDWKFEKRSLEEQLKRIANKFMSDKVDQYKRKVKKQDKGKVPQTIDKDASDLYDLIDRPDETDLDEELITEIIEFCYETSKDDDDLSYFVVRYFEKASFDTIAEEMGITRDQVYILKRKLIRRLITNRDSFNR